MAGSLTIDNINGKVISSSPVATESQVIGVGQTWQDVKASRSSNITYTNSTGKPIMVTATVKAGNTGQYVSIYAYVNGIDFICDLNGNDNDNNDQGNVSFIVPPENTYKIVIGGAVTPTFSYWFELR